MKLHSHIDGAVREHGGEASVLFSPMDLRPYAELVETPQDVIEQAIESAEQAYRANRRATLAQRSQWLTNAAAAIEAAVPDLVHLLVTDIGKPRRAATFEAQRSAQFLRACAAEVLNFAGEMVPVDAAATGAGRWGFTRRVPYGVVAAITPFNAPINLLVQKLAPALATGNAVVVKPHPAGTRIALRVAEVIAASGLPAGLFNVVTGDRSAALALVQHRQVEAVTFTGGTAAGDALVRAAGAKKFVAELGSNAANIVLADADIVDAAKRIASAAFEASGQQCISAQRIIVEKEVHDEFVSEFVTAAKALRVGDPDDDKTDIGPMVSMVAADRVMSMLSDAMTRGGRFALEPSRRACLVSPAIVTHVPREATIWRDEAFGPVAVVEVAADVEDALRLANDSQFGLQGAVFTRSLSAAFRCAEEFDVGSMWVNEASRFRLDMYPFGGVRRSGFGREGVRYAMEELSQLKFIGLRPDA